MIFCLGPPKSRWANSDPTHPVLRPCLTRTALFLSKRDTYFYIQKSKSHYLLHQVEKMCTSFKITRFPQIVYGKKQKIAQVIMLQERDQNQLDYKLCSEQHYYAYILLDTRELLASVSAFVKNFVCTYLLIGTRLYRQGMLFCLFCHGPMKSYLV